MKSIDNYILEKRYSTTCEKPFTHDEFMTWIDDLGKVMTVNKKYEAQYDKALDAAQKLYGKSGYDDAMDKADEILKSPEYVQSCDKIIELRKRAEQALSEKELNDLPKRGGYLYNLTNTIAKKYSK